MYVIDPRMLLLKPISLTADWLKIARSLPNVVHKILPLSVPFLIDLLLFGAFVLWNGGIVLGTQSSMRLRNKERLLTFRTKGDKSNHVPSTHIPQLYYFVVFATFFGWPMLVGAPGGPLRLIKNVYSCMFGARHVSRVPAQ